MSAEQQHDKLDDEGQIGWLCHTDNGARHFVWFASDPAELEWLRKRYVRFDPLFVRPESGTHTDHPLRHFDRTCPACTEGDTPRTDAPACDFKHRLLCPRDAWQTARIEQLERHCAAWKLLAKQNEETAADALRQRDEARLAIEGMRGPLANAVALSATRTPTVEAIKESIQRNVPLPGWAYEDEIVRVVRDFAPSTRGLTFEQVRDALVTRMNGHTIGASDLPAFRSFVGLLKRTEAADCGIALSATGRSE